MLFAVNVFKHSLIHHLLICRNLFCIEQFVAGRLLHWKKKGINYHLHFQIPTLNYFYMLNYPQAVKFKLSQLYLVI